MISKNYFSGFCFFEESKLFDEYLIKNDFTLKFKPKDIEDMVNQIAFAINNQEKRVEMASQGNQFVSKFSWKKTIDNFEEILKSHSK